jgi:plastocyanin domain-containing protein
MTLSTWLVIVAGIAAIAWVNWYFFLARRPAARAVAEGGTGAGTPDVQVATVTVKGGYEPADIRVRHGLPVRLVFDRQETDSCSEELVFPAFGIRRALPAFRKTAVEFTPESPGVYPFTCGMSMLHGSVTAE